MFDLAVPQPIMNMVERTTTRRIELVDEGRRRVMLAVLLMGLLFSITTFTCTAPFIGGLLAGASASGQFTRPILGMVVFSTALAIPFFFLAVFPAQLKKLPKAGGWLNETKVVMGFVELAAAVKFLNGADLALGWGIFTRNVCLAIWIAIFGLTGLYLVGAHPPPEGHAAPEDRRARAPARDDLPHDRDLPDHRAQREAARRSSSRDGCRRSSSEFSARRRPASDRGPPRRRVGWDGTFEDDYEGALAEAKTPGASAVHRLHRLHLRQLPRRRGRRSSSKNQRASGSMLERFVIASLHLDGGG